MGILLARSEMEGDSACSLEGAMRTGRGAALRFHRQAALPNLAEELSRRGWTAPSSLREPAMLHPGVEFWEGDSSFKHDYLSFCYSVSTVIRHILVSCKELTVFIVGGHSHV